MAFAILFNTRDLAVIEAAVNNPDVPRTDQREMGRYWGGGFNTYQTATAPPPQYAAKCGGDADCRLVVTTYGTLAAFRALALRVAAVPGNETFSGVAYDLQGPDAAIEPYP